MAHHPNSFLETIIAFLMPYFIAASRDKNEARSEIIDTLAAYETRTRTEMLHAAHIIALGLTTLDVLAESKTAEMSQSMRLRYRSCGNGLNRAMLRTEEALDQRLGDEIPAPNPALTEPQEPIDDMCQAEIMAVIEQHKADVASRHPRVKPATTAPHPVAGNDPQNPNWDPQLLAAAMIESMQQQAAPTQPSA